MVIVSIIIIRIVKKTLQLFRPTQFGVRRTVPCTALSTKVL